jgi:hypothetical protein
MSGDCEQCHKHSDDLFNWLNYQTNQESTICMDCVIKNNARLSQ